jgi:hypothetical protein
MKRTLHIPFAITSLVVVLLVALMGILRPQTVRAAPFTAGNIVIYRAGDGISALANTGNPIFLDEYTPAGVLVQSIPMPTAPDGNNNPLVGSGGAGSEGGLTRTTDGRFLVLAGYNSQIPAASSLAGADAAVVNRVIGRVDAQANIDTTTSLNNYAAFDNPREVASDNGTRFWAVSGDGSPSDPPGLGGVFYATLGATSGITITGTNNAEPTNLRAVNIFGGQLYVSSQQGAARGVASVGTGLPTTPVQPIAVLPGHGGGNAVTASPTTRDFVLLDLEPSVPGVDTMYSAHEYNGLRKYSWNGSAWALNGVVQGSGANTGTGAPAVGNQVFRRLIAVANGSSVTIYATRYQVLTTVLDGTETVIATETNGELVRLTDASGYNGGFAGIPTVLIPARANIAIRGVAPAPVDPNAPTPTTSRTPTNTSQTTPTQTSQPTATTDPNVTPSNRVLLPLLTR